jgi:Type II secretion system (T2SS), protein F
VTRLAIGLLVAVALLVWTPDAGRRLGFLLSREEGAPGGDGSFSGWRERRPGPAPPSRGGQPALEPDPALVLDLVAAALSAGAPPEAALQLVGDAVGGSLGRSVTAVAAHLRLGSGWDRAWADAPEALTPLRRTLALAGTTGAPGAGLLRDAADDLRRRRDRQAQAEAARLGVRMVLPLGLCALPAFVAWAVVPVVLSLAGRLLGG